MKKIITRQTNERGEPSALRISKIQAPKPPKPPRPDKPGKPRSGPRLDEAIALLREGRKSQPLLWHKKVEAFLREVDGEAEAAPKDEDTNT